MKTPLSHLCKTALSLLALCALALGLTHTTYAAPQAAAILTVNSTADTNAPDGKLSFREAILLANAGTTFVGLFRGMDDGERAQISGCSFYGSANNWGLDGGCGAGSYDTIRFDLGDGCPCKIQPLSTLPKITDPGIIDGYSQSGATPNTSRNAMNAGIMIELDGQQAGLGVNGLTLNGGTILIRGLAIHGFTGNGVVLSNLGNDAIVGNQIFSNGGDGIYVSSAGNFIGDTTRGARNQISGNGLLGIEVLANAPNNSITNNLVGLALNGKGKFGNHFSGIATHSNSTNIISNRVAFNSGDGVKVLSNASFTELSRNAVFSNGSLGFDINGDGVTTAGLPVLVRASSLTRKMQGTVTTSPNKLVHMEFYKSGKCDDSGYGEGKVYLGTKQVTTDGSGFSKFKFKSKRKVKSGESITAVAYAVGNYLTEYSKCISAK